MSKHLDIIFKLINEGLKDGKKPTYILYSILTYIYVEQIKEYNEEKGVKNENKL